MLLSASLFAKFDLFLCNRHLMFALPQNSEIFNFAPVASKIDLFNRENNG